MPAAEPVIVGTTAARFCSPAGEVGALRTTLATERAAVAQVTMLEAEKNLMAKEGDLVRQFERCANMKEARKCVRE